MTDWLPWAPSGAAILHITEEFVYPGGFQAWYQCYRTDSSRITPRFLTIVNGVLLVACLNIALFGRRSPGIPYWLLIAALLCSNGIWHAWAAYKSNAYSPGMITGLLLYIPMAIYGYSVYLRSREVSPSTARIAAAVGGSYTFWSALYHGSLRLLVRKRTL